MQASPCAAGVVRITTPLRSRPRTVHAYLLETSGGPVLVDGGAETDEAWEVLDAAVRVTIGRWSDLKLHLVTHMHVDHIGLAGRIRRASGSPLAMGRLDAERTAHAAAHPNEEAGYRTSMLRSAGADAELVARAGVVPDRRTQRPDCEFPIGEAGGPLLVGSEWRVLWTPGHTAGHVSLFRDSDRVLIAGDAVLPRISPTIGVNRQRPNPVGDYLDALDRLESLRPALALPGHGDPVTEPRDRIGQLRAETLQESDRVLSCLRGGASTVAEVVAMRYAGRALPDAARVQAIRETRAHLDRLTALGTAAAETHGDLVCFWPS